MLFPPEVDLISVLTPLLTVALPLVAFSGGVADQDVNVDTLVALSTVAQ